MNRQVIVAVEGELSDHDATEAAAHSAADGPVNCHLLIATRATTDAHNSLAAVRALAKATGSQEVVLVTDADSYPQQAMPEWRHRASVYLKVSQVQVVAHAD